MADQVVVRRGQGDVKLSREQFEARLRERFYDPEFERVSDAMLRSLTSPGKPTTSTTRVRARERLGRDFSTPITNYRSTLDRDTAVQEEVRNAARALATAVGLQRAGQFPDPDQGLQPPRPK